MLDRTRTSIYSVTAVLLLLVGCLDREDSSNTAPGIQLVPAGKLRVGVYSDDPLADSDGVAKPAGALHDLSLELGKELARRLGVEF